MNTITEEAEEESVQLKGPEDVTRYRSMCLTYVKPGTSKKLVGRCKR